VSGRVLLLVICLTCVSGTCFAQPDAGASRSVEKANSGLKLFEQGKWQEALALFREADTLYHSPVFVLYAARCLERAGRWTAALAEYERLAAEPLPASAPKAWLDARAEGRAERDALEAKVPRVVIEVEAAPPAARASIDGQVVAVGHPQRLDPGPHRVVASDGSTRIERRIELVSGRALERVVLRFPRVAAASAKRPEGRRPNVPALLLGGTGAAALVAGGVVGVLALKSASDAKDDFPESCSGSTCPASRRGEIEAKTESARTLGSVSNGLLIGGAVALAGGVVWWLLDPGSEPPATARARRLELRF